MTPEVTFRTGIPLKKSSVPQLRTYTIATIMGLFSFLFAPSTKTSAQQPKMNPTDVGRSLRQMMLTTPVEKTGEKPTKEFPRIYAVLIDWPIGEHTATVFASSSGAASLYTTSTFGIIGGEGHATVRTAAQQLVSIADKYFDDTKPAGEYPYPTGERVRFYFLTFSGVRVAETDMASISSPKNKYSELFGLGQVVLTELRMVTEKRP